MRNHFLFAAVCALAVAALPARAADTAQQSAMKSCAATWKTMSAADKGKTKYTDYMSTCMKAPSKPAAAAAPTPAAAMTAKPAASSSGSMMMAAPAAGGQAKCKDGTTVTYKNRQGTCSGHGGVATWL